MILPSGVQLHIETDGRLRCRLDTDHARGWLTPAPGAQCVDAAAAFATEFATAIGKGFVAADAAVTSVTSKLANVVDMTHHGIKPNGIFANLHSPFIYQKFVV